MAGGQYLFAGLSGAGNSLARGMEIRDAMREQQAQQEKERAQKFSKLAAALDTMGVMTKDQATTRSLDELEGIAEGIKGRVELGNELLKRQQVMAQLSAMANAQQAEQSLSDAIASAGQPTAQEAEAVGPGAMPVTSQRIMDAIARQHPAAIRSPRLAETLQAFAPSRESTIPAGFVALDASVDENGKVDVRYGPPKAEGKALTQTEVQGIAALNQAESDLNTLENIYKGLEPDYGGPVSGRVKSMVALGQNPNIAALENAITAATPNLARGVFREVGVLTEQDVARYKQLLPAPTDTQAVRDKKIKQLRERITQGRREILTNLKAAGRDVDEFATTGGASAADGNRFDSEEEARSAGAKPGDVIELYDPATGTYRKARLK